LQLIFAIAAKVDAMLVVAMSWLLGHFCYRQRSWSLSCWKNGVWPIAYFPNFKFIIFVRTTMLDSQQVTISVVFDSWCSEALQRIK